MTLLWITAAAALTLDEAVQRAAEVDPDVLVAALEARRLNLDAAEAWTALGPTPTLAVGRAWESAASTTDNRFSVSLGLLDAGAWFDALKEGSQARAGREVATATRLDAQYATAALYLAAWYADAATTAAQQSEAAADTTLTTVRARGAAGLDNALLVRSAEAAQLLAGAERAAAEGEAAVARVQLGRALQIEGAVALEEPGALVLPEGAAASPWLQVAQADLEAARWDHAQDLAGWLPTGSLSATTPLDPMSWRVTLGATWTFDGLAGPFLRERNSALAVRIAEVQLDGVRRDYDAALAAAVQRARAAARVVEAHRAREAVSGEALALGQAQLAAGLISTLEVLRLQDQLADARGARVRAELDAALAVLAARQAAGAPW